MESTAGAVKNAVHQHPLYSLQGLNQRFFSAWFNSFIYNQIWEDPDVDLAALELDAESRVLTIASGGCNILNYLTASPAKITALDINAYHLALTRLKIKALEKLPDYESYYDFFGYADKQKNQENYDRYISPYIGKSLDDFWRKRTVFGGRRIVMFTSGLYKQTRFGYFMRFLHFLGRLSGCKPEALLEAKNLQEQRLMFEKNIQPFFDNMVVRTLSRLPVSLFSLGIPPQQYAALKSGGGLVNQLRERVSRLACDFPVSDNYFAWQGFKLAYDHDKRRAVPAYLKKDNYSLIREQLHKVETHSNSLHEFLAKQPANSLNRYVLLDSLDWMSDEVLTTLFREIARTGEPGSRVIFRTAASDSPLERVLPDDLMACFTYEAERSETLFKQDRSAIYGGFHLYILNAR
ncbi:MAG: DUF3419 family protein [Gammaproteobacteria bacterium]|nr:DUF3419 family protein [Gammaproteobacteria bacterium]